MKRKSRFFSDRAGIGRAGGETLSQERIRRIEEVLTRFFRSTDTIGFLGGQRFGVLISGALTESVVWEKTAMLSQVLRLEAEIENMPGQQIYIGVYIFGGEAENFDDMLGEAEYALLMARRETERQYYVHAKQGCLPERLGVPASLLSPFVVRNYMDEGIRLLEVGEKIRPVFISPGYYQRLSLDPGSGRPTFLHPDDQEAFDQAVRSAMESGKPVNCRYRVSADRRSWIACSVRFLDITSFTRLSPMVLEISHDISSFEKLKGQLEEDKEWIQFILKRTDNVLWEADLKNRQYRMLYAEDILQGRQSIYENFPESLIESGRIHRDSAERFRKFVCGMYEGRTEDSGNFMIRYRQTSCFGWGSMSYHMLFDEKGHPAKAIGIKEDLSYLPRQQGQFMQRRVMPSNLYPHLYCFLQANLTEDTVEKLQLEGREQIQLIRYQRYTELIRQGVRGLFFKDDLERVQRKFDREQLLRIFGEGCQWIHGRYRLIDQAGVIRWVSCGINLSRDIETGNVCLFAYMSNMEQRYQWERSLGKEIQMDPETGVYLGDTPQELAEFLLRENPESPHALAVIWVEGLEELFQGMEPEQQRRRKELAAVLAFSLDTDCVVGRLPGRLSVFFPVVSSQAELRRRLLNAFSYARLALASTAEMKFLRFVAGVIRRETDYETALREAERLCGLHAGEAEDTIVFQEEGSGAWAGESISAKEEPFCVQTMELAHLLTEEEKDLALDCMGAMLRAGSGNESINQVLQKIGVYYQADRVCILTFSESDQVVNMLNEWTRPGKMGIQQALSGKRLREFPLLLRFAQNAKPMIFNGKSAKQSMQGKVGWQFGLFPMETEGATRQLLFMEGVRQNGERTALLDKLLPYLHGERKRFLPSYAPAAAAEKYAAIPNLGEYMDIVYSLDSDLYSSLGALTVEVQNLQALREQRGYEYGSGLILRISEILTDVFGNAFLFHVREGEFVVLSTNTIYELFYERCRRVKILLDRQYARKYRMGHTWSDGIFNARDLVHKARSIMVCDHEGLLSEAREPERKQVSGSAGQFTIYLQPKVDMRSGALVGAEALVRVLGEDGSLRPHGKIIDQMEQDGTIRELDYFVFDRALSVMSQWRQKGYPAIPVSSNFSRNTLLSPSALASVLAILSRYPEVSQDQVELEITETAGDFESNTFAELIERFRSFGLLFSLDDFGSHYSNLSMLANIRFRSVKLDRSMVQGIAENSVSQMMVRDLVELCEQCGMLCIAEGVETEAQIAALLREGCYLAQGYYYGRPMPVPEFEKKFFQTKGEGEKE